MLGAAPAGPKPGAVLTGVDDELARRYSKRVSFTMLVADDLRIVKLHRVLWRLLVPDVGQRRRAQRAAHIVAVELVAHRERVLLSQLQIDARRNLKMVCRAEKTA